MEHGDSLLLYLTVSLFPDPRDVTFNVWNIVTLLLYLTVYLFHDPRDVTYNVWNMVTLYFCTHFLIHETLPITCGTL